MKSFIDLCAGTGAFSIALESSGKYKCVYANDMMKSSQDIYNMNHENGTFNLGDMMDIDVETIPPHDLLCSGFPCQPFSIAGDKKGFDDDRSNVFWKIVEILKHHKPETIILENVKNLTSHDKKNTFKVIKSSLEACGYAIKYKILDTTKISSVPQHRERIYIVGFRDKNAYDAFNFDFESTEKGNIVDFIEDEVPEKYYYTDKLKVFPQVVKDVTKHIKENVIYQYRRYYIRENKSNCCPTLTANMGGGGHNVPIIKDDRGVRKLTPRECFNLQGFPSTYKFPKLSDSALYKLAGNAVSVPVISLVVSKLVKAVHIKPPSSAI